MSLFGTRAREIVERRGSAVEGRHPIHVAVADVRAVIVDPGDVRSPWRSCAKPFQLWGNLRVLGDATFEDELLAIGASSHSGTDDQVSLVRRLLARLHVEEAALGCGTASPAHEGTLHALLARGERPAAIHNDCSGKHAFMIAAARKLGPGDYRDRDHPLQVRLAEEIASIAGERPILAVDGCALPTYDLSLRAMARSFAWLGLRVDLQASAILDAMIRHPQLVSGPGRIDLAVSSAAQEPCVAKIGARAVYGITLPERSLGIALKCLSADEDALAAALPPLLDEIAPGAFAWPDPWPWAVVRSKAGIAVGERRLE
jgi:L-asparaginase II